MIKLGRRTRAKSRDVRFYVYRSDSKINMLYEQMPSPMRQQIAGELKLKPPFVEASVKTVAPSAEMQTTKLQVVERWLELSDRLGTIRDDSLYFRFSMPMQWGYLDAIPSEGGVSIPRVVFFYEQRGLQFEDGSTERQLLALGGSAHHIIGSSTEGSIVPMSNVPQLAVELGMHYYLRSEAQRWLTSEAETAPMPSDQGPPAQPNWTEHLLELAAHVEFEVPKQNVTGIAIRFVSSCDDYSAGRNYRVIPDIERRVFGSPLYVALDDGSSTGTSSSGREVDLMNLSG